MHVLHLPELHAVHDLKMPLQNFNLLNNDGIFPHFFIWVRTS